MTKIFAFTSIFVICSCCWAQDGYGLKNGQLVNPLVVPEGTVRIHHNIHGATLYDKNGYSGRIYNTANGRMTFSKNGGYVGRTYQMQNGDVKYVPTYRYRGVVNSTSKR